jgi:hypothetical protein
LESLEAKLKGKTGMGEKEEKELIERIGLLEEEMSAKGRVVEGLSSTDWVLIGAFFLASLVLVQVLKSVIV